MFAETSFLLLPIGILIFWIISFMLGKRILKALHCIEGNGIIISSLLATAFTFVVVMVMLPYAVMFTIGYEKSRKFSRERWCEEPAKRYEMRKHILRSSLLIGKTKMATRTLLDSPTSMNDSLQQWIYDLGTSTAGFGWQFNSLVLTFSHDTVVKTDCWEVID